MDELKLAEYAVKVGQAIGWEICAFIISPMLATRFTNISKAVRRMLRKHVRRFHPSAWHFFTWYLTYFFSYYSLIQKYPVGVAVVIVSFIIACFNSAIVEWIHRKAEKSETATAVVNKIMYIKPEENTMMTRMAAVASGVTVLHDSSRTDETQPRTEVWTEEKREEARRRSGGEQ